MVDFSVPVFDSVISILNDRSLASRLGNNAREYILDTFDREVYASSLSLMQLVASRDLLEFLTSPSVITVLCIFRSFVSSSLSALFSNFSLMHEYDFV